MGTSRRWAVGNLEGKHIMESNYWNRAFRRQMTRRRALVVAGQAGIAGALVACGGGDDGGDDGGNNNGQNTPIPVATLPPSPLQQAKFGGTVKIGYSGASLTNLDPHTGASGAEHQFFFPVTDSLVGYDQKGNLDASISLAEKWELTEPTRVTLKLRTGIKFTDGTDFSADDVKWNVERVIDPALASTPRSDLAAIESVQVVDKTTAILKLKQPSAPLLTNLGDRGGQIISRTAFEKLGKDAFRRAPVGTGAFTIKEWRDDAFLIMEKNPNYWRKDAIGQQLPYLQTIRVEMMPDQTVRTAAFDAGNIDVLIGAAAADVKRYIADSSVQTVDFIGSSTAHWYTNHAFPPMDNVWFRRALSASMDRKNYIKNFLVGDEPIPTGFLTPATWAHDPTIENYNFDIAKAKQYLQQSGLPPEQWKVKAQPFGTTISDAELFWATSVKEAGITIEWGTPERDGWQKRVLKGLGGDGSAAMFFSGFSLRVDPDGHAGPMFYKNGAYNAGQAATPEVEPLLLKARETYDQAERKKLYSEAQKKAVEMQYSSCMIHYSVAKGFAKKKVGNFSAWFGGEGKPRFANLWV